MKHLARNVSDVAQIDSSLVLVRKRWPVTPSWSPKSSSFESSYSLGASESCRTYTWIRSRPSDSTRNAAFPKFLILTIRPAVTVSTREASSSAASAAECAATSAVTVWVVAKRLG